MPFKKVCSLLAILFITTVKLKAQDIPVAECKNSDEINVNFSKSARINRALSELTSKGIPGCAIAVYSEEGWCRVFQRLIWLSQF
jgi:hypothetical protein